MRRHLTTTLIMTTPMDAMTAYQRAIKAITENNVLPRNHSELRDGNNGRPYVGLGELCEKYNVSVSTLGWVNALKRAGREDLLDAVFSGSMSLRKAYNMVQKLPYTGGKEPRVRAPKPETPPSVAMTPQERRVAQTRRRALKRRERAIMAHGHELAVQMTSLLHRLKEIAEKASPEEVYHRISPELMHNLDETIEDASKLVLGVRQCWRKYRGPNRDAAD